VINLDLEDNFVIAILIKRLETKINFKRDINEKYFNR